MFAFARKHGYVAIFFFISLVIIGVMIFLNLFLAILLENFDGVNSNDEIGASSPNSNKLKDKALQIFTKLIQKVEHHFK